MEPLFRALGSFPISLNFGFQVRNSIFRRSKLVRKLLGLPSCGSAVLAQVS
jgi:hypothetical protein